MLPKAKQYTVRTQVVPTTPTTKGYSVYLNPTATAGLLTLTTTKIEQAAAFDTPEAALQFWNSVAFKFGPTTKAEIVLVERVETKKLSESRMVYLTPGGATTRFALKRTDNTSFPYLQRNTLSSVDTLESALLFKTTREALAHVRTLSAGHVEIDIVGVVETTTKEFKITPVQGITPRAFQKFAVTGSSCIDSLAYAHEDRTLRITFKRNTSASFSVMGAAVQQGDVYEYKNVAAETVFEFLAAPSKGTYYTRTFKPKHDGQATKVTA
jgi:hypothetical protein